MIALRGLPSLSRLVKVSPMSAHCWSPGCAAVGRDRTNQVNRSGAGRKSARYGPSTGPSSRADHPACRAGGFDPRTPFIRLLR